MREHMAFPDNHVAAALYGQNNVHLKLVERQLGLSLHARGNELTLIGPPSEVAVARSLLGQLEALHQKARVVTSDDVLRGLQMLLHDRSTDIKDVLQDAVVVSNKSRPVIPKSVAQQRYLDAIRNDDIVFGIGPAGTGKTYLAMAMAVKALLDKQVRRIVLCRPAVEAGEKLGFLPGTMQDKVNPYLRPLYDALNDLLDMDRAQLLMDRGQIEVAPLAFMRGRTLNDSFVILDEAQNTTGEQMKMFLTRLGYDSKAVITGDITQVDLPARTTSGLVEATRILAGIPGIEFVRFSEVDVVRHPLVAAIISAYDRAADRGDRGPGRALSRDGVRDQDPTAGRPTGPGDALDELEPLPGSDGEIAGGGDAG
ncbi:MAG: PhoH family protein [Polyangia bacterium]